MTLILAHFPDDVPVFHGDTLLTRDARIRDLAVEKALPRVIPIQSDFQYAPAGFCQKVVLKAESLIYCWAGSRDRAAQFDAELEGMLSALEGRYTYPLHDKIEYLINSEYSDLELFVGGTLPNGAWVVRSESISKLPIGAWGPLLAGGSGSADFWGLLCHLQGESPDKMTYGPNDHSGVNALLRSGHIEATLMQYILTEFGLENACGGVVETARFHNGRFVKQPDTLFIFWAVEKDAHGRSTPQFFLRRRYVNGHLRLGMFNFYTGEARALSIPSPAQEAEQEPNIETVSIVDDAIERVTFMITVPGTNRQCTSLSGGRYYRENVRQNNMFSLPTFNENYLNQILKESFKGADIVEEIYKDIDIGERGTR